MRLSTLRNLAAGVAATACLAVPAHADGADDLQDLVGARGGQAEMSLQRRGYEHVETHQAGNVLAAHWWNEEADDCVLVRTYDGRYQSITDASDQDCGHHEGAGTAAAIGVIGIGAALIAALASNHHNNDDHGDNDSNSRDYRAQYDRGFSDGLHNATYHNYDRSDGYANGYEAGVQQRDHNLRHRRHHRGGGYQPSVDVSDLNGARAAGAMSELDRRGFRQVDNFTSGNTRYSIQWRPDTRQCLQATVADGRIYDIRDIGTHPRCN